MATGLCAKRMKWHVAETIEMYTLDQNRVFNLQDHVKYLKIQWEENGNNKYMVINTELLDSFDKKTVKSICLFHWIKSAL